MKIIAYRGTFTTIDALIERLQERREITTQDIVENMSIACFDADAVEPENQGVKAGLKGIGNGKISIVKKKHFDNIGAQISSDPQSGFNKHALLSGVSAEKVFEVFTKNRRYFDYKEPKA